VEQGYERTEWGWFEQGCEWREDGNPAVALDFEAKEMEGTTRIRALGGRLSRSFAGFLSTVRQVQDCARIGGQDEVAQALQRTSHY
jgi:hypothetical protein